VVEDAVDEAAGLEGGVELGEVYGLVDGDDGGDVGVVEDFAGADAEDVAVDGSHAVDAPVFGGAGDDFVEFAVVEEDVADDGVGEAPDLAAHLGDLLLAVGEDGAVLLGVAGELVGEGEVVLLPEEVKGGVEGVGAVELGLEEELEGAFASGAAGALGEEGFAGPFAGAGDGGLGLGGWGHGGARVERLKS
jgi:hypothetical protein